MTTRILALNYGDANHPIIEDTEIARVLPRTVYLDGVCYTIEPGEFQHSGLPATREGVTTDSDPGETLLDHTGTWWRHRFDWSHGAGAEDSADLDRGVDARMFAKSRSINVWDRFGFKLHERSAASKDTSGTAAAGNYLPLAVAGGRLFCGMGLTNTASFGLMYTTDLVTWTQHALGATGGYIYDLASDGANLYVACATRIFKIDSALTQTTLAGAANGATMIEVVAGRLLGSVSGDLQEIGTAGVTPIIDGSDFVSSWSVCFAIGSKIYAGGHNGYRSVLYSLTTDEAGLLVKGQEAADFPAGELLLSAVSYAGIVLLGTSKGVRLATTGGDGTLTYGPLIDQGGECRCLVAEGEFAWFGWPKYPPAFNRSNYPALVNGRSTGIPHASVRVATTANGTWATAFDNASTVDGIVLNTGDHLLVKDQTDATKNGIYVVAASGAPTRRPDVDTASEVYLAQVDVREGTVNAGSTWFTNVASSIVLDTSDIDWVRIDLEMGLGRIRLDEFTDTLQPSFASDVRMTWAGTKTKVLSVARFLDRTVFGVEDHGVYASVPGEYEVDGFLDSGALRFGTLEQKRLSRFLAKYEQKSGTVWVALTDETGVNVAASAYPMTGGSSGFALTEEGAIFDSLRIVWTLDRNVVTGTPVVKYWQARAFPVAYPTQQWIVPIVLAPLVNLGDGEGEQVSFDVWGQVDRLVDLWCSKKQLEFQIGTTSTQSGRKRFVRIDNFQVRPAQWNDDGSYFTVTVMLQLLSV